MMNIARDVGKHHNAGYDDAGDHQMYTGRPQEIINDVNHGGNGVADRVREMRDDERNPHVERGQNTTGKQIYPDGRSHDVYIAPADNVNYFKDNYARAMPHGAPA